MLHEGDYNEGTFGEKMTVELAQLMDGSVARDNFERRPLGCVWIKVVFVFTLGKENKFWLFTLLSLYLSFSLQTFP